MAGAGDIRAGRAFVELFAKDNLSKDLAAISAKLQSFGSAVAGIGKQALLAGGGILAGIGGASKVFAEMGTHLLEASKITGASVEFLSALGFAAEHSGASAESVDHAFRHLAKTLAGASEGSAEGQKALQELGLTLDDFAGMGTEQVFLKVADAISKIPEPANRAATAMKVFGRNGTELLPLFDEGAAGIEKLMAHAQELGVVFSTEDALKAKDFNDALKDLWAVVKMGVAQVGAALVPELKQVVLWLTNAASAVVKFVRENRALILIVAGVGVGLAAVGAALIGVGAAISFVGAAFAALATVVGIAVSVVEFLISPIGLIIAGLVAAGAAILYFTGLGSRALGALGETFAAVKGRAVEAWGGIKDAMAAGDLGLAAKVAWTAVKLIVLENTQSIQTAWVNVWAFLKTIWAHIKADALTVWATIKVFILSYIAVIVASWKSVFAVVQWVWKGITTVIGAAVKAGTYLLAPLLKAAAAIGIKAADTAGAALAAATGTEAGKPEEERQAINDQLQEELKQIEKDRQSGIAGVGEGVAKAQQDYQDALGEAADAAKAAAEKKAEPAAAAAAGAATAAGPTGKADVQGTFSALAIFGLGGKRVLDSIAETGKEQLKEQKTTNKLLQQQQPAKFS